MKILTDDVLSSMKNYKYQSVNKSLLERLFLNRFWEFVVKLFPTNMAPNTITMIGFIFMLFDLFVLIVFGNVFDGITEKWIFILASFCTFVYVTLDAIDGKQARRTMSSSPLGQLFDHVCDSYSSSFILLHLISLFSLKKSFKTIIVIFLSSTLFYIENWIETIIGIMQFELFGVTEMNFSVILSLLIGGIKGQSCFNKKLFFGLNSRNILFVIYVIIALVSVYKALKTGFENLERKFELKLHQFNILQFFLFQIMWLIIFTKSNCKFFKNYPYLTFFGYSIGISHLLTQLILSKFKKQNDYNISFVCYSTFISLFFVNYKENLVLFFLFFFHLIYSIYYNIKLINEISNYLNISIFKIDKKKII